VFCLNGYRFRLWIAPVTHCFLTRPKLCLGFRATFKYAQSGPTTLLVLWGGDKTSQTADIRQAQTYWNDYQRRKRDEQA
jgi:hypothetical protein